MHPCEESGAGVADEETQHGAVALRCDCQEKVRPTNNTHEQSRGNLPVNVATKPRAVFDEKLHQINASCDRSFVQWRIAHRVLLVGVTFGLHQQPRTRERVRENGHVQYRAESVLSLPRKGVRKEQPRTKKLAILAGVVP